MKLALPAFVAIAMASPAAAQTCGLSILGSGQPSTVLRFEVQAAAGDYTGVLVSDQSGSFNVPTPGGMLSLGVLQPWTVIETGFADIAGFAILNVALPAGISPLSLFGQGVVLRAPFLPPQLCATNVVPFTVG